MQEDRKREEEIRAFRRYARYGLTAERDPLALIVRIRKNYSEEVARDLLAVWDALRLLDATGREDCAEAARRVYFFAPEMRLRANEMTYRVTQVARELHCDTRTLYRKLNEVRTLWRRLRYYRQS